MLVRLLQILRRETVPQLLQAVAQGVAPGPGREHDLGFVQAHVLGNHDFKGSALLQHAILVNPRAVGKGIGADHGLVGRHPNAHQPADQPAGRDDFAGLDPGVQIKVVPPGPQGHDDLFERGIARPLPQAVEGALGLAGAVLQRGQGIGHGHAQIIVTVHAEDRAVHIGHLFHDGADQRPELLGHGVPDRIRDVDRGGPGRDRRLDHLVEIGRLGPGCIHRRKLHIVAEGFGPLDRVHRHLEDFVRALAQLPFEVDLRGADEGVYPGPGRAPERLPGPVDIDGQRPGQAADDRTLHFLPDPAHRLEVLVGRNREAGLDDIHLQPGQLMGDLELLAHGQGRPRGLFGIAQGRIEDDYTILVSHDMVSSPHRRNGKEGGRWNPPACVPPAG